MDELNGGKYKPHEVLKIADTLGLNNQDSYGVVPPSLNFFKTARGGVDSSIDMDSLTGSSSASLVSSESLRSSLENFDPYYERSRSNDLR